jgi:hypothetical protein
LPGEAAARSTKFFGLMVVLNIPDLPYREIDFKLKTRVIRILYP